jgi:uncharacterized protein (TIGR03067 family)
MKVSLTALLSLTVVAMTLSHAAGADDKETEKMKLELKALEGGWTVLGIELDGKDQPKEKNAPAKLEMKNGQLTGFGPTPLTFTIDPSKKPKHITLVAKDKDKDKDIIVNAIYELQRDNLKLVIPLVEKGKGPDNMRPEGFETKGKPVMLIKMKRAEPRPRS